MKGRFRIFRDELSSKDLWAIAILLIILLDSYFYTPTLDIENDMFYTFLKTFYTDHHVVYLILLGSFMLSTSLLVYFLIKMIYIQCYKNYFYIDEMYDKYIDFLQNSREVYIFGGDLDFLLTNKKQFELIKKLKNHCKILCNGSDSWQDNNQLYEVFKELESAGVQIRGYGPKISKKIIGFRGQIKIDDKGSMRSLFVKRVEGSNNFNIVDLDNQYVLELLYNDFNECFNKGEDVFIKHILFDLGGVFFDGDFSKGFLNYINKLLKVKIKSDRVDKLLLDSDLNLGKCTIVDWVEKKILRRLNANEALNIEKKWSEIWYPNTDMVELVTKLSKRFNVTVVSNLDKQNGDMYLEKGYLQYFSEPLFLSYQCQLLKPKETFWEVVCKELKARPGEILLIDDHEQNIVSAKKFGFKTIKYSNDSEQVNNLVRKLDKMHIVVLEEESISVKEGTNVA